ncbi:MAG TPA: hypothetical protein K8U83_08935 [Corynebacterium stationis]|nr:hypothetical protein [Corynebacterium stationis]
MHTDAQARCHPTWTPSTRFTSSRGQERSAVVLKFVPSNILELAVRS